jgi:chromosome segregation ATPase
MLTSDSLEQLRRLLMDAYNERDELTREISSATSEANTAARRYQKWERGLLMKRLFKQSFATRKETAETAAAKLEELQEQLRLTTIATEIDVDPEQAEPYYRTRDTFSTLSECQKIWGSE